MRCVILKRELHKKGGLEKQTWRIAKTLLSKNHEVHFLTGQEGLSSEEFTFEKTSLPSFFSYRKIRKFDSFCSEWQKIHKPSFVLGLDRTSKQTHIRAGNGVHAAFLDKRAPLESSLKNYFLKINPLHRTLLDIEKVAFTDPHLQKIIVNSHMVKEEMQSYYSVPDEKIAVLHNGVEWEELKVPFSTWFADKSSFCKKEHLPEDIFHILFVGNGYLRKGLKPLLEALADVHVPFHLSIVGKDKNVAYFKNLSKKLHLDTKVSFFGPRSDLSSFYQMADALVIPSYYDPFANVTVEALAMGLYVLSSKHNGGSEILSSSSGSIIESLMDKDSFICSIKEMLTHKKSLESAKKIREEVQLRDFSYQQSTLLEILGL